MTRMASLRFAGFGRLALALAIALTCVGALHGSDTNSQLKLDVALVWGANDEKSPDPNHKPVDPGLAGALSGVFKWKYYFVVESKAVALSANAITNIALGKCSVEVTNSANNAVGVKLFGEGKLILKSNYPFPPGKIVTLAGDVDKNSTAWFVVVKNATNEPPLAAKSAVPAPAAAPPSPPPAAK
jgi:hypothetical protein